MMDKPENYYAILGVPPDADADTIKRAYRQLARRFHPDLAGPEGAIEMKRINRAYSVLGNEEKRRHYDTITGGIIDLRKTAGIHPARPPRRRPHPQPSTFTDSEDGEFSGLNIFSSKGPLQAGPVLQSTIGIISALCSVHTGYSTLVAAGSLDGQGLLWQMTPTKIEKTIHFATEPALTVESLRALRFSPGGALLTGWGRLHLHVWDAYSGERLWQYPLTQRAVSAYYSVDAALQVQPTGRRLVHMALPLLTDDARMPSAWGVRGTDVIAHDLNNAHSDSTGTITCQEEGIDNRRFWAIRMRTLAEDGRTLVTLSCAQMPEEADQVIVARRWDLTARSKLGARPRPHITTSILLGRCKDCTPPYAATPDTRTLAFVSGGNKVHLCDTTSGTYSELMSGTMGGSARLALSPDGQWLAIAREDSEINEGVVDLWHTASGQIIQKFYHPWQISALHFANRQLVVALTDGTIQIWQ
ncbi:MAG: DnaJ domain-containing protein [Ktedonobacteraceae bacterium]|nr:DnaJ domain-containing protein [Ktedonobacteraceae bacterium]